MSDLFFNKIAAALLVSAIGFIGINKFASAVVKPSAAEGVAYTVASVDTSHAVVEVDIPFPSPAWLGAQDATRGAKIFKKCKSCHTADNGGKHGTGPALWNIVGRPMGAAEGFGKYSAGMSSKGGNWGYAELDEFLTKPKAYIPKTKMSFNGLKKEADRAALIEYLRVQADNPMAQMTVVFPVINPGAVPMQEEDHSQDAGGEH